MLLSTRARSGNDFSTCTRGDDHEMLTGKANGRVYGSCGKIESSHSVANASSEKYQIKFSFIYIIITICKNITVDFVTSSCCS
jgi:hypothetical protein